MFSPLFLSIPSRFFTQNPTKKAHCSDGFSLSHVVFSHSHEQRFESFPIERYQRIEIAEFAVYRLVASDHYQRQQRSARPAPQQRINEIRNLPRFPDKGALNTGDNHITAFSQTAVIL